MPIRAGSRLGPCPLTAPIGAVGHEGVVPVSVEDVAHGIDTELEAARRLIAGETLP